LIVEFHTKAIPLKRKGEGKKESNVRGERRGSKIKRYEVP